MKGSSVEVLIGGFRTKQLPNTCDDNFGSSIVMHCGAMLLCIGTNNIQKCLLLDRGTWREHSTLNEKRYLHSAVSTETATFLFGGTDSATYEYLPKDSSTWLMGKSNIPGNGKPTYFGFWKGFAIYVKSEQTIWLIGGSETMRRILSFNVYDHTFQALPIKLNVARSGHRCAFIPNTNKIMITGGESLRGYLNSTEILDTADGSVIMASPMNFKRTEHGMCVITINGEDRLAVFGGLRLESCTRIDLDSVELYNAQTQKWEMTDFKLSFPKFGFGFATVKLTDIISRM